MAALRSLLASSLGTAERRITLALLLLLTTLYIPFAGNYGLWDPWETHYSEVARQMLQRHDFVSLWWPGSPQDRNEFWSKPVLTFWLQALGMAVAGLERAASIYDGEMAVGWRVEWAVRMPFILCSVACVWATWELTRRLAGRRAGMWAAIILATSSQFFLVARQAMTDMAFVAPMTVALLFTGLALLLPAEEVESALPRRSFGRLSWPDVPIFYVALAMVLLLVVPPLVLCSVQVSVSFVLGKRAIRMAGVVPMLPWIGCLLVFLWYGARATCRRQIYFHIAYLLCGVATLAKGPAGIGLPVIILLLYLAVAGRLQTLLPPPADDAGAKWVDRRPGWLGFGLRFLLRHPLEIGLGTLIFIATTFPWYHGMVIRHGMGFWNEFFGDNYVHRAAGRHGDRGTFDYYILQIGLGMFPWTAFVGAGLVAALRKLRGDDGRTRLRAYAVVWFLVMFTIMSLVNTKFHHYILPGLPALAILAGLLIDELFERPTMADVVALFTIGVPLLVLSARDLALFPARLLWLFCYDYVNAPNGGRAWPPGAEYDYGSRIAALGVVVVAGTLWFAVTALLRARRAIEPTPVAEPEEPGHPYRDPAAGPEDQAPDAGTDPRGARLWLLGAIPLLTIVIAQLWEPAFATQPHPLARGWILVAVAGGLFMLVLLGSGLRASRSRWPTLGLVVVGVIACVWTGWVLDRMLTDVSPHWSQKQVIASYYQQRSGPEEPLVCWQMYWRGETFYTKNRIYDHRIDQRDKTVFLGDHNAEKLQEYIKGHGGRRIFFIVERSRFESLRALLPEAARPTLKAVDDSNNKIYLAVAQL